MIGNREIYVSDAGFNTVTNLTNDFYADDWPAWSPDGRLIAFTSDRLGSRDLFLMAGDGTIESPLTTGPAFDERPDWQVLPRSRPDDDDAGHRCKRHRRGHRSRRCGRHKRAGKRAGKRRSRAGRSD